MLIEGTGEDMFTSVFAVLFAATAQESRKSDSIESTFERFYLSCLIALSKSCLLKKIYRDIRF